jgi:hypothetical protein
MLHTVSVLFDINHHFTFQATRSILTPIYNSITRSGTQSEIWNNGTQPEWNKMTHGSWLFQVLVAALIYDQVKFTEYS